MLDTCLLFAETILNFFLLGLEGREFFVLACIIGYCNLVEPR